MQVTACSSLTFTLSFGRAALVLSGWLDWWVPGLSRTMPPFIKHNLAAALFHGSVWSGHSFFLLFSLPPAGCFISALFWSASVSPLHSSHSVDIKFQKSFQSSATVISVTTFANSGTENNRTRHAPDTQTYRIAFAAREFCISFLLKRFFLLVVRAGTAWSIC